MKRNWINIVATLLIVGGVYLLVKRSATPLRQPAASTRAVSDEDLKNQFYGEIGKRLGRPLDDIEKQMVTVTRTDIDAKATLLEPLRSRVMLAEQQRRKAEAASSHGDGGMGSSATGQLPGTSSTLPPLSDHMQPSLPTTLPGSKTGN